MDNKKWFKEAQFGMMVHFGLYSLLGGEWHGKCMMCHPSKNGHRKASKNGMNRSLSFVFEIRPHLFHGSLDNEPLPT